MPPRAFFKIPILAFLAVTFNGCAQPESPPPAGMPSGKSPLAATATSPYAGGKVNFVRDIKPIFELRCINCHNRKVLHGRMSLESRETAFGNSPTGAFIVPGNPEASVLFQNVVAHKTRENAMPPVGVRPLKHEKDLIYAWIKEGADWPAGKSGRIKPTQIPLE